MAGILDLAVELLQEIAMHVDAPKEQMSLWSTSRYIQNAVAPHTFHTLTLHATSGLVEALATGRSVRARHVRSLVLKSTPDENLEATVCNALSSLQELREVRFETTSDMDAAMLPGVLNALGSLPELNSLSLIHTPGPTSLVSMVSLMRKASMSPHSPIASPINSFNFINGPSLSFPSRLQNLTVKSGPTSALFLPMVLRSSANSLKKLHLTNPADDVWKILLEENTFVKELVVSDAIITPAFIDYLITYPSVSTLEHLSLSNATSSTAALDQLFSQALPRHASSLRKLQLTPKYTEDLSQWSRLDPVLECTKLSDLEMMVSQTLGTPANEIIDQLTSHIPGLCTLQLSASGMLTQARATNRWVRESIGTMRMDEHHELKITASGRVYELEKQQEDGQWRWNTHSPEPKLLIFC